MKKTVCFIVIISLLALVGSVYVIDHNRMEKGKSVLFSTWGKKYSPPEKISPQKAIEIVKDSLGEKEKSTITNLENPKIEDVVFFSDPPIACFKDEEDIVGKDLYKITFKTTMDALLGPLAVYVDKQSGDIVGADYRE